jgi:hypothetical protein
VGPGDDISIFIDNCVFARSVSLHGLALFEQSTDRDKQRMSRTAETLFGDLWQVIREYVILQVCKMTDPARDVRGDDNHTVAFLLEHYEFSSDPPLKERLTTLRAQLESFGAKLRPARNKLISYADRGARLGQPAWRSGGGRLESVLVGPPRLCLFNSPKGPWWSVLSKCSCRANRCTRSVEGFEARRMLRRTVKRSVSHSEVCRLGPRPRAGLIRPYESSSSSSLRANASGAIRGVSRSAGPKSPELR